MSSPARPSEGLIVRSFHPVEGTRIWLTGIIDEHFPSDAFGNAHGVVVIELSGIRRITSFGIREWCRCLMALDGTQVYFAGVATCMIPQFAMVAGFSGSGGQILSYQGQYACDDCGANVARTFDRRTDPDEVWNTGPSDILCAACGKTMHFDDITESHRIALMLSGPLRLHPALAAVAAAGDAPVAGKVAAPKPPSVSGPRTNSRMPAVAWTYPFEVHKQVIGEATLLWISGNLDSVAGFRHVAEGLEGDVVIVAPGIVGCDDAGVGVLERTIDAALVGGGTVLLARCAPVLVASMVRKEGALANAALVSVEHAVACPRCKRDSPYFMTANAARERGVYCATCAQSCKLDNDLLNAALAKLPCAATPSWLPALVAAQPAHLRAQAPQAAPPRWGWWLGALGLALVLATAASIYFVSSATRHRGRGVEMHEEPEATEDEPAAAAPVAAVEPARNTPVPARPRANPRPAVATTPVTPHDLGARSGAARNLDPVLHSGERIGEFNPTAEDSAPELPAQLTSAQLESGLAAVGSTARECYQQFHVKGTVLATATVSPSGRVKAVEIGGLLADTPTGGCVAHAVRQAKFPRFSGAAMQARSSYELR